MADSDSERERKTSTELRRVEFLVLIAGLVGIATTISPNPIEIGHVSLNTFFIPPLVGFMLNTAIAYGNISKGDADVSFEMRTVVTYFSLILSFTFAENFVEILVQALSIPPGSLTIAGYFVGAYLVFGLPSLVWINRAFRPSDES